MREVMLILHFIGLTMGLGTGFAHAFLGTIANKMSANEATKFRLHSLVLTKMGNIGIILLVVSGLYLATPYWKVLPAMPLLAVKLALVLILVILITIINVLGKRAKNGDAEAEFKKMEKLGKLTLPIGLAIVILAVNIFH
jgi:uncharacterized membrane protein